MVRNEVDIVGHVVNHLLKQGVDEVIVADNMSHDGTWEMLRDWSQSETRLHAIRDTEPAFFQAEKVTHLARVAWWRGADWIIPFDADEFWFAEGMSLADYLAHSTADVLHASFHHMIPTEDAPGAAGPTFVMDATPAFPGKTAMRTHPLGVILPGNHDVSRVGLRARGLHVAHAQYRSPEQLAQKVRQGADAFRQAGRHDLVVGDHWIKGSVLSDTEIAEVWANLTAGRPEPRIGFLATGPMIRVRPFEWETWDPQGVTGVGPSA